MAKNETNEAVEELPDHQQNQLAIKGWLASEDSKRWARAERLQELIDLGVEPRELASNKSPLDRAFLRGTARGQERPQYPTAPAVPKINLEP